LLLEFNHSSDVFGYGADGQLSKRFSQNHITLCSNCIGYWETTSCCEALGTELWWLIKNVHSQADVGEGVQFKVTRCIKHATALLKSTVGDEWWSYYAGLLTSFQSFWTFMRCWCCLISLPHLDPEPWKPDFGDCRWLQYGRMW
jgi:hypothetical protein